MRFLLISRMLWDKGVGEYVEVARKIKMDYGCVEFCLLGFLDVDNPTAISHAQMDAWVAEEVVNYLGETDDIRPFIANADCIVLPSYYREGVPRSLLEAAAMSRPIITTDTVGCREVVDDGCNGFLCRPRDVVDLERKVRRMILMTPEERKVMGNNGRKKVEREFDEEIVINMYLDAIRKLVLH
jgi:glycosyltransferase involved in cell wall biosynthesis